MPSDPAPGINGDVGHMLAALALARRGLGEVWPNPSVGCVVVRDGVVVGRGWTQPGGRPHGETEALGRAGAAARGATAYVSLEPCCHWGKTPPCADALIAAGIARVLIPVEDPDPRVSGQGIARLRGAGIAVEIGLCAAEATDLNAGFFHSSPSSWRRRSMGGLRRAPARANGSPGRCRATGHICCAPATTR
jgi:diaminohydroxyphosphoribosylaminopyrimidine deaminase / 5-amino-6-(5-phosphoribosylamino)uracil reductase